MDFVDGTGMWVNTDPGGLPEPPGLESTWLRVDGRRTFCWLIALLIVAF